MSLSPSARLQELIHRRDKVLAVLHPPTAAHARIIAKYPPIRFGDYAMWFASKSYQHMAAAPALPDAVVAPGTRATARW